MIQRFSILAREATSGNALTAMLLVVALPFGPAAMTGFRTLHSFPQAGSAGSPNQNHAAAEHAIVEARQLQTQATPDSLNRAVAKFEEALSLLQGMADHRTEAAILNEEAWIHNKLGDRQRAHECFSRALAASRAAHDPEKELDALRGIGYLHYLAGDNYKALGYYHRALALSRAAGSRRRTVVLLNAIGLAYYILGDNERALETFEEGLSLAREIGYRVEEASLLAHVGNIHSILGDKPKALELLSEAREMFRSLGNRATEAGTLLTIGRVYYSMNEYRQALDYFEQSLPLLEGTGNRSAEARAYHNMGRAYNGLGEYEQALDYLNRALPLWEALGEENNRGATIYWIGRVEHNRGNLSAALTQADAALNITRQVRAKAGIQELQATYLASVRNYYELKIDVLMRLGQLDRSQDYAAAALQVSEMSHARGLLEMLAEAGADIRQGVAPELLERKRALEQQLSSKAAEQLQLRNSHPSQLAAIGKEITGLTAKYQELQAEIRATSPRYAALTQMQPVSLAEIQQQVLDPDSMLLEYFLGDEHSYLWAVTRDSIESHELPKREEIEQAARRVYELLTARNVRVKFETVKEKRARVEKADAAYPEAAAALSQIVLGPIAHRLGDKRLLIVSDGALQYIPFAALPSPSAGDRGWGQGVGDKANQTLTANPMIVGHEISDLPSASTLAVLQREIGGRKPARNAIVVLADPVFDKQDERVKSPSAQKRIGQPTHDDSTTDLERSARESGGGEGWHAARLPFTRAEANAITELVPPSRRKKALDFAANRATATGADLSQYRIIHFATHGLLNSLHPELSGIVLSLVDERGREQNGFLRAHEIYNLRLPAELVVLSGCRTGLGKEIRGEGLIGLTQAFMYAGAARVMVSLWDINDKATAEFMAQFYRAMLGKEQLRPAAALRAAQVSMWKEKRWPSPYYWAAFVLQGETR